MVPYHYRILLMYDIYSKSSLHKMNKKAFKVFLELKYL